MRLHRVRSYAFTYSAFFRIFFAAGFGLLASWVLFDLRLESPTSDIHRYLELYDRYSAYLAERSSGYIGYLTSEVAFHFIYEKFSGLVEDPNLALRVFSFLSAFLIFLFSVTGSWVRVLLGLLVLSHPLVLDLVSSQQRMALAIALFLFVSHVVQGARTSAFTFFLGTIHTFMAALSVFQAFFYFVERFFPKQRVLLLLLGAIVFAVSVTVLKEVILHFLGDRRAGGEGSTMGVAYALMWLGTYTVILVSYPKIYLNVWGFMFLICALASILGAAAGVYSARYATLSVIFLASLLQRVKIGPNFFIILAVFTVNLSFSYFYWITYSN